MTNAFAELYEIDVSHKVEKKGRFSYLSWPYAVAELRKRHPTATWTVIKHEGIPYLVTSAGVFVEVAVTVEGVTLSQIHPVLNGNNKPIYEPTAFDINTSIQRCLVKAIALHGLGLYIYAGEDLPNVEPERQVVKQAALSGVGDELNPEYREFLKDLAAYLTDALKDKPAAEVIESLKGYNLDDTQSLYMQSHLDAKTRKALGMTYVKAA